MHLAVTPAVYLWPQVVLGKSATDDELLDALRTEVARLRAQMKAAAATEPSGGGKASQGTVSGGPNSDAFLRSEIQRLERLCRNQVRCMATRDYDSPHALPAPQADQIESQDQALRHLKQRLQT
jgi:hypothetical protein